MIKKMFLLLSAWWYKRKHFEFSSRVFLYTPIVFYALYKSFVIKDLFWIKYVNPRIYLSGIIEHSKESILRYIPQKNKIKSLLIAKNTSVGNIEKMIQDADLVFPLVIKPDRGSRGVGIHKVYSLEELIFFLDGSTNIIVQEMIMTKNEYGVFYVRYPNDNKGTVTSLVKKEFMEVTGDGSQTLSNLILNHERGWLYRNEMNKVFSQKELLRVIEPGKKILFSFIGSHSRGTIFYDKSNLITQELSDTFDDMTKRVPEFYYGRYDIKADSISDLAKGQFKVLELNAALAEPTHMYDPSVSFRVGYKILFEYWSKMFTIARQNKRRKVDFVKK